MPPEPIHRSRTPALRLPLLPSMLPALLPALLLPLLLAVACARAPGPEADRDKTPAEVEAGARELEREQLERVVADYKQHIVSREGELRELEADVRAKAGDVIDAVLGRGPNEGVRAEIGQLRESITAMGTEVRALHERLAIYSRELGRRD